MQQETLFPIEAGDSVTYIESTGFHTGYFVRWDRNGMAVIKRPSGGRHIKMAPNLLRPCNDGRMQRKRGHIPWPTPEPRDGQPTTRRKR